MFGVGAFVLRSPVGSVQLGASFGIDPAFLVKEIMREQTQNLFLLRLFSYVSVMLERIYVFKTSRTDCAHTNRK